MPIYKMKGKKDGKQKYRVRINFIDSDGIPRQTDRVVYGQEEAKLLEMKLNQELKESPPAHSMTVRQLFDEYMKAKKFEVKESTWDKSRRILEMHILPNLAGASLDELTPQRVQVWKQTMEEKATSTGNPLKLKTKQNAYKELSAMINYAVKMEHMSRNPLSLVGGFKDPNSIAEPMDYYTASEFKAFASAARQHATAAQARNNLLEWHYYVFFALAFYTGMRKGEIHALRWDDYKDGYISVKRSITQKIKGDDRETPPKNKSSVRTLQAPQPLRDILAQHYDRCKALDGFREDLKICGGFQALRDSTIQKRNELYAALSNVKRIRIHDFRHSHASILANEGINIQEIARRLGHSKIEITWNTYSHLYPREEERAISVLDKIV